MKRFITSITSVCLIGAAFGAGAAAQTGPSEGRRSSLSRREALKARLAMSHSTDSLVVDFKRSASRTEVRDALEQVDGEVVEKLPELGRVKVVEVVPGAAEEAVAQLAEDPAVQVAEVDAPRVPLGISNVPNDPKFDHQWGLHNVRQRHPITCPPRSWSCNKVSGKRDADVDALESWGLQDAASTETPIVVLDVGADLTHPDIANNRWENPKEIAGVEGEDDDGNGYVDDTGGWDFERNKPNPQDPGNTPDAGHGTHVAAIAAADTNNNKGIAGACPNCKVLHLRFGLRLAQELEAIDYLIATIDANPDIEIPILNVSFGSWVWSQLERDAFERLGDAGVLTVAAAGNGGLDNDMFDFADFEGDGMADDFSPLYPASYELPGILSVAATNSRDQFGYFTGCDRTRGTPRYRCLFSNWGRDSVDVAAPGTDIKSAFPGNRYATWTGTSMAAPLVAGIAGLVKAQHPEYSVLQLKNAIMRSVDKVDSLRKLWRKPGRADRGSFIRTNGRVNALSALTTATNSAYPKHDGMIAGAKPMTGPRRGFVSWPGDTNDVYSKSLKAGVRYFAKLRANHRRRNIDLVVYKPGTQDVWQLEDACIGGNGTCHVIKPFGGFSRNGIERIEFTPRQGGRHYFLVSSYFVDTGYRLKVRRVDK